MIFVVEVAYRGEARRLVFPMVLFGTLAALFWVIGLYQYESARILGNKLLVDGPAIFFKMFFILLGLLVVVVLRESEELLPNRQTEYVGFTLSMVMFLCFATSATHLLILFLALQGASLSIFFMITCNREGRGVIEAAAKFYFFQLISGFLFLFSVVIIFWKTQSLDIFEIHRAFLEDGVQKESYRIAFGLSFLSISFYLFAFPFYLWIVDVLDGVMLSTSLVLSVGFPALGLCVALRFFATVFSELFFGGDHLSGGPTMVWSQIVTIASGLSMLVGAFLAFGQDRAKRMFSGILVCHIGFLMIGLVNLERNIIAAVFFQLVVDLFSLCGLFILLNGVIAARRSDELKGFYGVLRHYVPEAVCLVLFLGSYLGLPPFPGFISQFILLGALVKTEQFGLLSVTVFSQVILVFSLGRFFFHLMGNDGSEKNWQEVLVSPSLKLVLSFLVIPLLMLGVFADRILFWAGQSVRFVLW